MPCPSTGSKMFCAGPKTFVSALKPNSSFGVAQNEWKKHPYILFLLLVQKETNLSGKNRKKTKKFQKPKSCRQLP
jgi:hypothetical protein